MTDDKRAAYETLHACLTTVAQLSAPFSPYFADWLYRNLKSESDPESVHLSSLKPARSEYVDLPLEGRMDLAQRISSMVLSIRKKENLRVRQPLQSIRIPILDDSIKEMIEDVKEIILSETNVKELQYVSESEAHIVKNIKLNFKTLGKKCGKYMKDVQRLALEMQAEVVKGIETNASYTFSFDDAVIELIPEDVEIIPVDIPGWKVANDGPLTVALDITLTENLLQEGIAREVVNRIQNLRKEIGLEVTDRINVNILAHEAINSAIETNSEYIRAQILAGGLNLVSEVPEGHEIQIDEGISTRISLEKLNN
jgi:isoleucyl-tRNA synthetase